VPLVDIRHQALRRNATELLLHMQRFSLDLKFTVSLSHLVAPSSRFHDGYREPLTVPERLTELAHVAEDGVVGIEAVYPNEINEDNLDLFRRHAKETGQRVISINPNLHFQRMFEYGALSNPDKNIRRMAVGRLVAALRLNRELETDMAIIWPGVEGYESPFGINFLIWRDRLADSLTEAMEEVPGVRIALEPKPGDPRGRLFMAGTSDALIMCARVESRLRAEESVHLQEDGHALVTLCLRGSNVAMAQEDLAEAFSRAAEQGRLSHTHWNSLPRGAHGPEQNVSVANPEQTKAGLYLLKMCGYSGLLGIDINPTRTDPIRAMRNSIDAIRIANERIEGLDHEHVLQCATYPEIDRGWIEAHLNRRRAPNPENLWPLGPPIRGDEKPGS
jgi:xylose isomerase